AAHAEAAVGEPPVLRRGEVDVLRDAVQHDEIVAEAVHFGEAKLPHRSRWGRTDSYQVSAWSSIECPEVCWSSILARWVARTHAAMETRSGPMGLSFARHVDVRTDLLGN